MIEFSEFIREDPTDPKNSRCRGSPEAKKTGQ